MTAPRLTEMNLNLLLALDALLSERSVSRAARRVGVSQPAMSQSLRQLRSLLGDALLVRDRGGMALTPAGERLTVPLRQALIGLQRALDGDPGFDPATARRRFVIAGGDHVALTYLPPLLERASREAPEVDIELVHIHVRQLPDQLATGDLDLALGALFDPHPDLAQEVLYHSDFACLVRRDHPRVRGRLDLDTYVALPHALISPRGEGPSVVDRLLERRGLRRRVALRVPYFLAAPLVVARSDLILTAPHHVARAFASTHPLALHEPPIEIPGFDIVQVWHKRFQDDPAHRWLRGLVAACSPA